MRGQSCQPWPDAEPSLPSGSCAPQFAARASSMTPALRHRSLAALRRVLTAQQAALFVAAGGGEAAAGAAGTCLPEVAAAAWRLAVLSSDLADAELAVRRRLASTGVQPRQCEV